MHGRFQLSLPPTASTVDIFPVMLSLWCKRLQHIKYQWIPLFTCLYCLNRRSTHIPMYMDVTTTNLESKYVHLCWFGPKSTVNSHCGIQIHLMVSENQGFSQAVSPHSLHHLNGISPSGCNNFRLTLGCQTEISPVFCWKFVGSYLVTNIEKFSYQVQQMASSNSLLVGSCWRV